MKQISSKKMLLKTVTKEYHDFTISTLGVSFCYPAIRRPKKPVSAKLCRTYQQKELAS
jgi:hypothetical protein